MRCPSCQQENSDSSSFCIFCGEELRDEALDKEDPGHTDPAGATDDGALLAELGGQVRALRREVREIRATLASHGIGVNPEGTRRGPQELASTASREPLAAALPGGTSPPREQAPMPWERVDWEPLVGGNWLARIGVLAVVIGTAFFLKLAFDNNWIGETGRVVLGVVGGLAFLAASGYWQKRFPAYAQALGGGGVAILYLSIFAAFALYGLIDFYPAVALLLLISATAAVVALRYESVALAIIGIAGAFVAPFILSAFADAAATEVLAGRSLQLIAYIIAVDLGVVALSTFRNWRWFTLLALLGSLAAFGAWYDQYSDTVTALTSQGSLTIIFLIFVGATTLFHIVWRRAPQAFDHALMVINAAAYFGISYGLLWDDFRPWMGGFTLLLSLFYGSVGYLALVRSREHVYLALMKLGIALVFLTIAVPVQVNGPWISVAWAVEGAVLMWLSFNLGMWQLRVASVGVFAALVVRLLVFDTPVDLGEFQVILNYRMLAFASSISALYLAAYLLGREKDSVQEREKVSVPGGERSFFNPSIAVGQLNDLSYPRVLFPALLVGANFLTLWVLSAEVIATVDSGIVDVSKRSEFFVKSLSLSLLWAVYASLIVVVGIVRRSRLVRLAGLALLAIPVLKLFLADTFQLEQGYRVTAYLSLGVILLIGGFLYQRYGAAIKEFLFEEQTSLQT